MIVPGFVSTPIANHARDGKGNAYGKTILANDQGMSAERCAGKIMQAIRSEKEETLIGGSEMFSVYLHRFFPRLFSSIIRNHPVRRLRFR